MGKDSFNEIAAYFAAISFFTLNIVTNMKHYTALLTLGLIVAMAIGFSFTHPAADHASVGIATYYSDVFHGKKTASGEVYEKEKLTAAHRTLPIGTRIKVSRLDNGRAVVVRINDRGPFVKNRIIDLSYAAAKKIGLVGTGVAKVKLEIIGPGHPGVSLTEENLQELMDIVNQENWW